MSYPNGAGCVTCEARNKKCDLTRGPTGCRRCTRARIACEGYLATRIPKPKHNVRDKEPPSSSTNQPIKCSNETSSTITSSTGLPVTGNNSSILSTHSLPPSRSASFVLAQGCSPATSQHSSSVAHEQLSNAPHGQTSILPIRWTTPPIGSILEGNAQSDISRRLIGGSMTPGQASLLDSIFSLAGSPPTKQGGLTNHWLAYPEDDFQVEDPENIRCSLLNGLVLDRQVESNMLPFIIHSFASWMSRFLFEPTRIIDITRDHILQAYGNHPSRQRMMLISSVALAVSRSTDYGLTQFVDLYRQTMDSVVEARASIGSGLTRELALRAMEHSHEFISTLCRIGSLANVLNVMDLYAPVFRRACPEPGEILVNLPRVLTTINIHLQFYATLDVLQSVITHRPMFFRYTLDFLSPHDEELVNAEDGPGLRWLYGVPDRLMITLARMNILLEESGSCLNAERARKLEKEIEAFTPKVCAATGTDLTLNVGRVVVQESWRLAAYVYLYMGLCGADSSDARVINVQQKFMRLLETVRPRRNPDSFLVLPIVILGIATSSPKEQSILFARLWRVSECNKLGTMGNDVTRVLSDLWFSTTKRPAVWSDLRFACLRVIGM
ncbi:hypothetical protein B0J17DRAFT_640195 [Rhizoctonia solani]|nr:hypothetical protein B0J17DRAFT_640195 [Rhizoctonia solani]